jgi:hypothetical protein
VYWDAEETPSVEAPVWALLGAGPLQTSSLSCAPDGGELRFPMPFAQRARIEVTNVSPQPMASPVGVQADWDVYQPEEMRDLPPTFHASWIRENPANEAHRRFCVARTRGHGALVGLIITVSGKSQELEAWPHAPGDCQVVDALGRTQLLAGLRAGDLFDIQPPAQDGVLRAVRFFPETPLCFRHSLLSTVGAVAADMTGTAYWYQYEPHGDFLGRIEAEHVAQGAHLVGGMRDLSPGPQEGIEWLCDDGRSKLRSTLSIVDLGESRSQSSDREEVLWTEFRSPDTRTGQMCVSHDGYVKVVFNGRLVFERDRAGEFGVDPVAVMIPAGNNAVRLQVRRAPSPPQVPWLLGFRIANSEGRTIEQMEFQTYPDVPLRTL